jgi:hypothetical protein
VKLLTFVPSCSTNRLDMNKELSELEYEYHEACRARKFVGPGPDADPSDRALYHYTGRRDPVGVIHDALKFYRLWVEYQCALKHPLMYAMSDKIVALGPRDSAELRAFMQGVISVRLTGRRNLYEASIKFDFMYHAHRGDAMEEMDRYSQKNLENWLARCEFQFAGFVARGEIAYAYPQVLHPTAILRKN